MLHSSRSLADGSFVFFVVREAPYACQSLLYLRSPWLFLQRTPTIKKSPTMMRYVRNPILEVSALCTFFCLTAIGQSGRIQPGSAVSNEVVQGFQNLENTWSQAVDNQIAQLLQKHDTLPSLRRRVVNVRDYGDITIVVGTFIEESRNDKQPLEHDGVFTHVYQQVHGTWRA